MLQSLLNQYMLHQYIVNKSVHVLIYFKLHTWNTMCLTLSGTRNTKKAFVLKEFVS